tara:strand:+ start:53835 stop:54056 length:222 start_codon:yes stop_codon:yes gene_type:complete
VDVIIVSQFLENQGKITTINVVKKIINSPKLKVKLFLRLINLNNIHKNERRNITIPVGFVKNIKPNEAPVNEE